MRQPDFSPRIMIIDDEEIIRKGVSRLLGKLGYEIVEASTGVEGLNLLLREPVHAVLLDLKMPGMDGMEVLRNIVKARLDVSVIVITGHGTIEDAVSAIKMGAYDFITKPFLPDHLKQVVGRALERRRLEYERDQLREEYERGLWTIVTEKSRLKAVINSMSEGVIITEHDKTIILCNPAFVQHMRMERPCVTGANILDNPKLAPLNGLLERLISSPEALEVITQEITIDDDQPAYLRASINTIRGARGQTLGYVGVVEDVSFFKEMERSRTEFVSMMTHELRAPLGAIDTQMAVIQRGAAGDVNEKQREMLDRIRARIKGMNETINDLLDLSKIDSQRFSQEKKAVDVAPIIKEACSWFEELAAQKGLTLKIQTPDALPLVFADPGSIRDVMTNLLSNAIRYTPSGGSIEIVSGVESDNIYIRVADTGIGIAASDQVKIFDRFYRVKNERTRHIVGTGLGLPIVKAIVDDHKGRMDVQSEMDKGSVFTVFLPVTE